MCSGPTAAGEQQEHATCPLLTEGIAHWSREERCNRRCGGTHAPGVTAADRPSGRVRTPRRRRLKRFGGAAPESNRASRGLHDRADFEDRLGESCKPVWVLGFSYFGTGRATVFAIVGAESASMESHFLVRARSRSPEAGLRSAEVFDVTTESYAASGASPDGASPYRSIP